VTVLALVAATSAAWFGCRPVPSASITTGDGRHGRMPAWPLVPGGAACCLAALPGHVVVLGALLVAAAAASWRLWQRRSRRLERAAEAARIEEACEHLAAELTSGQPPGTALRRVAVDCPALASAAEAFGLGGDVPAAMREASAGPGRGDLRLLAAGWQVAHRSGASLAVAVERITASLRADQHTARLVAGELASARATARLVAGLPVLSLTMGSGAGGSPWAFLFTSPVGLACLGGGLFLTLAGLWWIEALTGDAG
jgi:tight adherence protein B